MQSLPLPELLPRAADTHKGSFGSVLVVAGSERYPGAALLAALGAGRAGAGLVHLAVPSGIAPLVLPAVPFVVLHRAAQCQQGGLAASAAGALLEAASACDAVVLGPGLGPAADTGALVLALLESLEVPVLLDADGLNHVARAGLGHLAARTWPTVLTPHPGELSRLDGAPAPSGDEERRQRAVALAVAAQAVVVLKGHRTLVTDGRRLHLETAGNPGMATGGMGDVLAGFGGALLAVLPDAAGAAALAVHLHALAGDLAAAELGEESVLPGDVADRFGRALAEMRGRATGC